MKLSTLLQATAIALVATACSRRPVKLVAGAADTVVVNNRLPVPLPVHGLDARGRRLAVNGLQFRWLSGDSIPLSRDGLVTCDRRADASVRVTRADLSTDFRLLCRPIFGFQFLGNLRLVVGGPSEELRPGAIGVDGKPEALLAGIATVRDSTVVHVDSGRIIPVGPGRTSIDIEAGDCGASISVEVDRPVDSPAALEPLQAFVVSPLRLAPGEIRSWRVAPGPYEVWFDGGAETPGLLFGTASMNCARWGGDGERYNCIAMRNASVIVRNQQPPGRGKSLSGALFVRHQFDPWRDAPAGRRLAWAPNRDRAPARYRPPGWCSGWRRDLRRADVLGGHEKVGVHRE